MAITRRSAIAVAKEESTPPPQIDSVNEEEEEQTQNPESEPEEEEEAIDEAPPSNYEQCREQRIKENRERLQKLGIVDLSLKLKTMGPSRRTPRHQYERKTPLKSPALAPSEPPRRSTRLQNVAPATYTEPKEDKTQRSRDIVLEEGAKPEIYTEEHEKLLGSTEKPWTFFVDGYGPDGNRIYSSVDGKTCHQCRQKTLGLRTRCTTCSLVQGQFCGDCLYMRYGEHVEEANENPNWVCPPCRGICNCSLCRKAKGWYPTGAIYRRISSMGYKSVAHYLIATQRAPPPSSAKKPDSPQSAKRALPFEGMEVPSDDGSGLELIAVGHKTADDEIKTEEITEQSGNNKENVDSEPKQASKDGRQTRKRIKKENIPEGETMLKTNGSADAEPASNMKDLNTSASNADSNSNSNSNARRLSLRNKA